MLFCCQTKLSRTLTSVLFNTACAAWSGKSIIVLLPTGIGGSDGVTGTDRLSHAVTHRSPDIVTAYPLCTKGRGATLF